MKALKKFITVGLAVAALVTMSACGDTAAKDGGIDMTTQHVVVVAVP